MRIFLAPMEGVVDHHMRKIMSSIGGIDLCVTEFVRITGHRLPRKVFLKYSPELEPSHVDNKLESNCLTRVQLLGSDPDLLAQNALKAAQLGAPGIDLNFGCPAKTVNRNRGGACLLNETRLLHDIVFKVRQAVPKDIPVTAKIRLGYESRNSYLENSRAIFEAGATELIVHARSKADGYKPPAYWECIAEIREQISIPVVANGEIWSLENYLRCKKVSGCSDFMLGRGLLAQPDLARAIKAYENKENYTPMSWAEIATYLHHFFKVTSAIYPKKYLGNRVKQWLYYLKMNYPQASTLFDEIKKIREEKVLDAAIIKHMQEY